MGYKLKNTIYKKVLSEIFVKYAITCICRDQHIKFLVNIVVKNTEWSSYDTTFGIIIAVNADNCHFKTIHGDIIAVNADTCHFETIHGNIIAINADNCQFKSTHGNIFMQDNIFRFVVPRKNDITLHHGQCFRSPYIRIPAAIRKFSKFIPESS